MSVIKQLEQIYPSIMTDIRDQDEKPPHYLWFKTDSEEIIGIKKDEIHAHDSHLLSIFLTPVHFEQASMTERERHWTTYLESREYRPEVMNWPHNYRFMLFRIEDPSTDKEIIKEAFQSLFPQKMPLLWISEWEGFIIEEIFSDQQEVLSFEGIPDVLMSDFYTNIQFFLSEFSDNLNDAPQILEWAKRGAEIARDHKLHAVVTYKDIIPYLYLEALPDDQWKHIKRSVFAEVLDDKELLQTVRVFLEAGSNTTLAAKKLYMHRNSLQYRVDKFIEKTGLDIKQFNGALITYLALLQLDY
ncbi:PucR family transcriptional regulator [Halobacillus litoralis]|uniref:PucR family transcriptional regulator n=1 Tax=Halobacillus litoralis TaxID=45668 RepID=UPI001CFF2117|nr:helix-turn-helix domain-containing protein [Halobacillus litoralis]